MNSDDRPAPELKCAEKLEFNTRKEAEASAVAIEHQRGTKLKAYKCRECELWHLASA
jgi:hypothetical protein